MLDYHFKTFSHFTTYCKRNIGATPNEIRKKGEESRDTPPLETYSVSANDYTNIPHPENYEYTCLHHTH